MSSTIYNDLRLILVDGICHNLCKSICCVILQKRIFDLIDHVSSGLEAVFLKTFNIITDEYCTQLFVAADIMSKS